MKFWTALVVAAVIGGALVYYLVWPKIRAVNQAKKPATLTLAGLPDRYCPVSAEVVVVKLSDPARPIYDDSRPVTNCRQIGLDQLWLSPEFELYVRLPEAAAFKIALSSSRDFSFPVQLGDLNADNQINNADELIVLSQINAVSGNVNGDLDSDGSVTVLDLSLVRLNFTAGVSRPDGQAWKALVS